MERARIPPSPLAYTEDSRLQNRVRLYDVAGLDARRNDAIAKAKFASLSFPLLGDLDGGPRIRMEYQNVEELAAVFSTLQPALRRVLAVVGSREGGNADAFFREMHSEIIRDFQANCDPSGLDPTYVKRIEFLVLELIKITVEGARDDAIGMSGRSPNLEL